MWQHFGYVKIKDEVSQNKIACRHCKMVLEYSGNTSNLNDHIKRKHPSAKTTSVSSPVAESNLINYERTMKLTVIKTFFSQRANVITDSISG